ncbi:E3 ubiquitin-protein ligase HEL1 KNAG_0C01580 [Huiozyma naganishii CBS 8797]|uniref:RBR-type E3 ubiquitin transferase n=1 Tax=Huiozyma naganishii (strain ATCC MYA-139 / BCRC 22969 / CBS 8797 / KCTC 17520 / NBRC 10181 / NCYC 3082 / Yp74L-3) TaxID=1071383 RepID=J7S5P0_HUIN7|nr:hypothetical protein KNAG_0C01580 [Kazachstania naganishii CBS 8797]CCK69271.1 hypothetical protein KNAG_0C01580 [Kazachstania naganishii CBS 8797]
MHTAAVDAEHEYVYEDDFDGNSFDDTSAEKYTDMAAGKKRNSIMSQESEFEIDDQLYSDDDGTDAYNDYTLVEPLSTVSARELNQGTVPNLKYECLTAQSIFEKMVERVNHLKLIFNICTEDLLSLMQHFDWNEERLLESWTDKMDDLLVEIGLKNASETVSGTQIDASNGTETARTLNFRNNFSCMICCEEKTTNTFSLECGHEYCIDCYRHYVNDKLNSGNIISCIGCSLALKNDDIDKITGSPSSKKLMMSSIKSFVQKHNKNYRWCPFTDCNYIIHLKDTSSLDEYARLHYSPFVKCSDSHRFCFSCAFEIHAPADCNVTALWVNKSRKESANLNWVLSNTKECPKCSVNIEKDGGCNHMVCSGCKYEFCWICERDWTPHGKSFYQCTLYKSDDDKKNAKTSLEVAAKTLKKYTFYYKMFNAQEESAKLDWTLGQAVGAKVRLLQEKMGVSWIEGQFLAESVRTLYEGRTALKWSFAVAYYSDASHNLTKIFVDNQSLLSAAVEDLSELLEIKEPAKIMDRKTDFYNKAGYVENRTSALIECGRDLLCKGICKPV